MGYCAVRNCVKGRGAVMHKHETICLNLSVLMCKTSPKCLVSLKCDFILKCRSEREILVMLSDKRLYNSTTSKHGTINFITFYHKLFIAIYYLITHECGIYVFTYLYLIA